MATRSALASLPARLRPTSAATAAGGWRRLLSVDPTKGTMENTLEGAQDEDKPLEGATIMEGLPMASVYPGLFSQAENEKNSLKDQLELSMKEINQLKDQLEKAESAKQLLTDEIHKFSQAENEKNSLKDQVEQSRKVMKRLKDQLEKVEDEKQLLKDQIRKDLETIVTKQTVKFETKLANDHMHVDEIIRKMQHCSEELKRDLKVGVALVKEKCLSRAEIVELTKVLEEKNVKFQEDLIGKVQQSQYNVVKRTALAGVVIGAVVFFLRSFFKDG